MSLNNYNLFYRIAEIKMSRAFIETHKKLDFIFHLNLDGTIGHYYQGLI